MDKELERRYQILKENIEADAPDIILLNKINDIKKRLNKIRAYKVKIKEITDKRFLVRIEDASGMEINPRKYIIIAKDRDDAILKTIIKEDYSEEEAKELMKTLSSIDDEDCNYQIINDDLFRVEVDEIN